MSYGFPSLPTGAGHGAPMAAMEPPRGVIRIGEQCLWSTWAYADATALAGRQNDVVFQVAENNAGQGFAAGSGIDATNMQLGGELPSGYAFDVQAIALQPYTQDSTSVVGADLRNIWGNLVMSWRFQQTYIRIGPASLFGSGGGVFGSTADTGAVEGGAGGSRVALNLGAGQLWVYRDHAVVLPAKLLFGMAYLWGPNATAIDGGATAYTLNLRTVFLGVFQAAIEVG